MENYKLFTLTIKLEEEKKLKRKVIVDKLDFFHKLSTIKNRWKVILHKDLESFPPLSTPLLLLYI